MIFSIKNIENLFKTIYITKMSFYAVAKGREIGIFRTWNECEKQIIKFSGARFKKFKTENEAENFIKENSSNSKGTDKNEPSSSSSSLLPLNITNEICMPKKSDKLLTKRRLSISDVHKKSNKRYKYESIVYDAVGIKKFGDYDFPIDANEYVIVYTDGGCENNGMKNAAAGFGVYFNDNHPLNTSKPVDGRATNNCGEIQAAIYALNIAKNYKIDKIIINTDSQFLINSATKWIWNWYANNWKLKSGEPVKNQKEFKELYPFLKDKNIKIKWNYTKGHNGIKGNDAADSLATQGIENYKKIHNMK